MEQDKMTYTDKEILEVIKLLQEGEGDEDQLAYWLDHQLKGIEIILDVIFHSDDGILSPDEILQKAREKNKPILL